MKESFEPIVSSREFFYPNDSDKISDSRCAYFDWSDNESSVFDIEQYFDYIEDFITFCLNLIMKKRYASKPIWSQLKVRMI